MQTPRSAPLRVAIVAASLRIIGGHSVQAIRMLQGWRDDPRVDAWVVPIDPIPRPPFDRLLSIKYVRTLATQLWYWPLLIREIRRADVVHIFSASYSSFMLAPLPAIVVAKLLGRPVILNYHSGEAAGHLRKSAIARAAMRSWVDLNVVPSPFLREVLAGFGIDAQVVANTIDIGDFTYRPRQPLAPRLLSTRNLEPVYNLPCTLRAFARVQARYPEATLTVVGGGSQEAALRALAARLDLRNVTFTGQVPPSAIRQHYADADIYVQTPVSDNMPLSVLEAFASGLPVVSTDVGGVPALLTDGVHGLLAPNDDDAAVASQVLALLERPDDARRLAEAAHARCAEYGWPVVREGWLRAYRTVVPAFETPAQPALNLP
jgi:glycosyltransferase involved in cell wall biosynthesis